MLTHIRNFGRIGFQPLFRNHYSCFNVCCRDNKGISNRGSS